MMFMLRIKYLQIPVISMKLILLHRLGGKPIFKEGRMSDTWACVLDYQAGPMG
jgi:hypothetical protein